MGGNEGTIDINRKLRIEYWWTGQRIPLLLEPDLYSNEDKKNKMADLEDGFTESDSDLSDQEVRFGSFENRSILI